MHASHGTLKCQCLRTSKIRKKNKKMFFGKLDKNWEEDGWAKPPKNNYFHDIFQFQKWAKWGCGKFCPISAQHFALSACVRFENNRKQRALVAWRIHEPTTKFEKKSITSVYFRFLSFSKFTQALKAKSWALIGGTFHTPYFLHF